jgi:hypothetical protein
LLAFELTVNVADRAAVPNGAAGVKPTVTVHEAPTAKVAGDTGHILVCEKSAAFVPDQAKELNVIGACPVFFKLICCVAALVPNVVEPNAGSAAGVAVIAGLAAPPLPVSEIAVGEPVAL